jgi:phosphatidylglycerophosphate synthase
MVIVTLGNPRDKFWGMILALAPEGLSMSGIELASFEDLVVMVKDGESFTPAVVFFPMHRIERIELDLPDGSLPSLSQRFSAKTGLEPAVVLGLRSAANGQIDRGHGSATSSNRGAGVKLSQIFTAPNQLTLLRMVFVPFIVIELVDGRYFWALILFVIAGFSDGLDGLLARKLHQQTLLGQYLDPIADKLLLSTMFLVLSILHKIPWKFTVLVFSRDISILAASAVLFAIAGTAQFPAQHLSAKRTRFRRSPQCSS